PDRHILGLGNLFITETCLGEQHEGRPHGNAESSEGGVEDASEVLAVEALSGIVVDGRFGSSVVIALAVVRGPARGDPQGGASASLATQVDGGVTDDPDEPGTEAAAAVE